MGGEGDERLILRNLYELSPKEEKEHQHGRKRLMDCLLYGRGRRKQLNIGSNVLTKSRRN